MDQPGKIANSAACSWSAEQGKSVFICPRSRLRFGLARRVRPSRPVPRQSAKSQHSDWLTLLIRCLLTGFLPISAAASIYDTVSIPPSAIGSVQSSSSHVIAYRWRSLPRVRRHRANSPQGGSSDNTITGARCYLFLCRSRHEPINVNLASLFPTPTIIYSTIMYWYYIVGMCDTESIGGALLICSGYTVYELTD